MMMGALDAPLFIALTRAPLYATDCSFTDSLTGVERSAHLQAKKWTGSSWTPCPFVEQKPFEFIAPRSEASRRPLPLRFCRRPG